MAKGKGKPRVLIERNTDAAEWGEKPTDDAYDGPLNIAGEQVDVSSLPKFGPERGMRQDGTRAPLAAPGTP